MKKSITRDRLCKIVSMLLVTSVIACGGGGDASVPQTAAVCGGSDSATDAACKPVEAGSGTMLPPPAPRPCGGNPEDYAVGLVDEFESVLDRKIWNDREWYNEPVSTKNYEVSGGSLKLWLQRHEQNGKRDFFPRILSTSPKVLEGGDPARTGHIQRYGCFEIEAKLPSGKGQFPAFWLFTPDAAAGQPEIDIMEAYPRDTYGDAQLRPIAYLMTTHVGCTDADPECDLRFQSKQHDTKTWFADKPLSSDFHRYALKWEPDRLTFYFDGTAVHTTTVAMADPMYLLIDTKPDPKSPPDDTTPTKRGNLFDPGAIFEVNYVRTWCFKKFGCR
jgi:hypothetical protein